MDYGFIENMLSGLANEQDRQVFRGVFKYVCRDVRFGRATNTTSVVPSKNFGGGFFTGRTPSVANQEFAVAHTFNRTPYLLMPAVPLDQVNASLVRLTVSRPADATNVYLKSPDTSQPFFIFLEG